MNCRARLLLTLAAWLLASPAFAADREASFMPLEPEAPVTAPPAPAPQAAPAPVPPPPVAPPIVAAPVELAKPVTAQPLPALDPQAVGLLTEASGGLGASLWDGTPRILIERLLPALPLPAASPTLNNLARRLLLSTAAVPEGDSEAQGILIDSRLKKLLALGDAAGAAQLAQLAKPEQVDDATLRLIAEAALLGPAAKEFCEKLPAKLATQKAASWQKAQIVCQLQAGDTQAAQLGLDMLRERPDGDEVFVSVLERNVFGAAKHLPRQVTPLRPLILALLRQTGMPLPQELYARPEAALLDALLQAKAANEASRLTLAEKAAAKGLISTARLAAVYREVDFTTDSSAETAARQRAQIFQALSQEQTPTTQRLELIGRFLQVTDASLLTGTVGQLLADAAASVPVTTDHNRFAGIATRLFTLAGRMEQATVWYKLTQGPAGHLPDVRAAMKETWPLLVLSGLVSDADYARGLKSWLDDALKLEADQADKSAATPKDIDRDRRLLRQRAGSVLALFGAAGYAVPDDAWARVVETVFEGRRIAPPSPVLLALLRGAGSANHRGEAVLMSLLLAGGEAEDVPLSVSVDVVRALREVGLAAEAGALAREAAARVLSAGS